MSLEKQEGGGRKGKEGKKRERRGEKRGLTKYYVRHLKWEVLEHS